MPPRRPLPSDTLFTNLSALLTLTTPLPLGAWVRYYFYFNSTMSRVFFATVTISILRIFWLGSLFQDTFLNSSKVPEKYLAELLL